jgi:hypothetical protein
MYGLAVTHLPAWQADRFAHPLQPGVRSREGIHDRKPGQGDGIAVPLCRLSGLVAHTPTRRG